MIEYETKAGQEIEVSAWPQSNTVTESTDFTGISSTSFTAGVPACEMTFTTPDSGRVGISVGGSLNEGGTNNERVFLSVQVFEGSDSTGTEVLAPVVANGVSTSGAPGGTTTLGNFLILDQLTPGVTHYARTMHAVEAGTDGSVFLRRMVVIPLP